MSQYTRYPILFGYLGIYPNAASLPANVIDGAQAVTKDTDTIYVYNAGTMTWLPVATPGAAIAIDGLTGDVSASGPGVVPATINNGVVTNAKLATMPNNTVKGNKSGGVASPSDLVLSDVVETGSSVLTISNGTKSVVQASNLTIQVSQSGVATSGFLSSTDWNTFNNKQAAGNYITALTGDATASGPGSAALTLATVNGNVGSFGSSTSIPSITVNAKGLITAASGNVVIAPAGTLTGTTLAANVVTSSLTTVGTIGTGTWNGTTIAVNHGGTSLTTLTANNVILGNGTSAPLFVAPGTSGNILTSNGTTWTSITPAASGITQLTGDVTAGPGSGSQVATIANSAVTNAKMANMAAHTFKMNNTGSSAAPLDITPALASVEVAPYIRSSYIFVPGGTATNATGGNVYTSWATLYADLIKTSGERQVFINDNFATVTMPAGTYDLSGVTFGAVQTGVSNNPILYLADGVIWSKLPEGTTNSMFLTSQSNSPIWTSPGLGDGEQFVFTMGLGTSIDCIGSAEMFKVTGSGGTGDSLIIGVGVGATVTNTAYEVVNVINNAVLLFFGDILSTVGVNTVRGDSTIFTLVGVGSYTFNSTQTNFSGIIVTGLQDAAAFHYYNPNGFGGLPGPNAGNVQDAINYVAEGVGVVDRFTAAAAGSHTISNVAKFAIIDNSTLIATYTLTMPAAPQDGQEVIICAPFAVTALTLSPNSGQAFFTGGAITTFAANGFVRYLWQATPAKWYRVG